MYFIYEMACMSEIYRVKDRKNRKLLFLMVKNLVVVKQLHVSCKTTTICLFLSSIEVDNELEISNIKVYINKGHKK